ncbi:MAG: hypothetical protein ABIJ82_01220 [Patescibacteria group bacterium]
MSKFLSNIFNLMKAPKSGVPNLAKSPIGGDVPTTPNKQDGHLTSAQGKPIMDSFACPYCASKHFVRRGFRQKKMEKVQLYLCMDCNKTFTQHITRGKHYPLPVVFDAISTYNLGYSLEETCRIINSRTAGVTSAVSEAGPALSASTLSNWLNETSELCRFERMREYALKKYSPENMVVTATLAHRQLYRYRFHRAKCELIITEDFKHHRFGPLQEFLEMVPSECPHQYFQEGLRASEVPLTFSKTQMIVRSKQNYATALATFILQSVKDRKLRHDAIQKFMLANDTVTVATEVPVYLTHDDLEHLQTQLGFEIYDSPIKGARSAALEVCTDLPKLITGHIDILQIRNGQIHILDFKPDAAKEQPIEQLTLYAMALSRLTGLRLFEFKCAWFDEKDYFEFYPLHVLLKTKKSQRRRKVYTMEGVYKINRDEKKVTEIKPTKL